MDWIEEDDHFVVRKPLESLTLNEVSKIRDGRVREIVEERLRQKKLIGGRKRRIPGKDSDSATDRKIPAEVWKEPLYLTPSGNKAGEGTRIRKVRIVSRQKTLRPIRDASTFVKPGKNHHLCLFECTDTRGKKFKDAEIVSMLEASERVKAGDSVVQRSILDRPQARFLFSLSQAKWCCLIMRGRKSFTAS